MLKLERIDGIDTLSYFMPCGCGITGLFPADMGTEDMANALIGFSGAVAKLQAIHELSHRAAKGGSAPTTEEIQTIMGAGIAVEEIAPTDDVVRKR